jgi:hypothetical protein
MTDQTTAPVGVVSSNQLGADSIVWIRHNGKPHTSGVAHFGGECPPGWVGGARPFFSAEYLAAAVAAERERWQMVVFDGWRVLKGLDENAQKRTSHQNVSDTLDALVRVMKPNTTDDRR